MRRTIEECLEELRYLAAPLGVTSVNYTTGYTVRTEKAGVFYADYFSSIKRSIQKELKSN